MALSHVTSSPPLLSLGWALIKFVCIFRSANESRRSKARPCAPLPPCTAAKTLGVLYWGRQEGGVDELKRLIKLRFSELRAAEEKRPILAAQISNSKGRRMRLRTCALNKVSGVAALVDVSNPSCQIKSHRAVTKPKTPAIQVSLILFLLLRCPDSLNQLRCQRCVFYAMPRRRHQVVASSLWLLIFSETQVRLGGGFKGSARCQRG